MWSGEPWLYHSHLSCALNLKLLNPREVVHAAQEACRTGHAPLAAVEGFIRQILGWREFVRGIYWSHMPEYLERNALDAQADLPVWYWTGATEMACLNDAITQTLEHGYAHHIQRLSNHCKGCRYDPALSTGATACPFTSMYWDFLMRHEVLLRKNPRMAMQLKNQSRLDAQARDAIGAQAAAHRQAQQ